MIIKNDALLRGLNAGILYLYLLSLSPVLLFLSLNVQRPMSEDYEI